MERGFIERETIRPQQAFRIEHAEPHALFFTDLHEQGFLTCPRSTSERFSGDLRFDPRQLVALVEELGTVGVEVKDAAAQKEQRKNVHSQDPRSQRQAGTPAQPVNCRGQG